MQRARDELKQLERLEISRQPTRLRLGLRFEAPWMTNVSQLYCKRHKFALYFSGRFDRLEILEFLYAFG
jgi:hypothetical protein